MSLPVYKAEQLHLKTTFNLQNKIRLLYVFAKIGGNKHNTQKNCKMTNTMKIAGL